MPTAYADQLAAAAMVNLIGNARKFSQRVAHPQIEVGAQDGVDEVTVYVRDNGVGFQESAATRMFRALCAPAAQPV